MAIAPRNLRQHVTLPSEKQYYAKDAKTVVFAPDAGIATLDTLVTVAADGDTWPILTPVFFDAGVTDKWKVWAATNTVDGFVIGASGHSGYSAHDGVSGQLQLDDTDDVQGVILFAGDIDYHSIFDPVLKAYVRDILAAAGTVTAGLVAALQSGPREKGLIITGLDGVY